VLLSVLILGFVNTLVAYLIYYSLVRNLGSVRTGMVTYVLPPVGLLLGAVFLNEQLDERVLIGAGLILVGIAVVNLRLLRPAVAATLK
jgi:drug/metabolite transporter (DMT)-like permease